MEFSVKKSVEILEQTPAILTTFLENLSDEWIKSNEGPDTWSPYDVVGHLVHGEKTDWISRINIILSDSDNKIFEPFDRFAQLREDQNKPIKKLLDEFKSLRKNNLEKLKVLVTPQTNLNRTGMHPALGEVTLRQLLATWAVHDLNHIAQISRVMAKQFANEVGPWKEFLRIVKG